MRTDTFSDEDVREAFRTLSGSKTFSGSDRLIGFLHYVVNEQLEGRGDLIRGKSIAMDVYGYEPHEVEKREGVVRVDGGRVRRKLEEYYSAEGSDAHIRIDLPKGRFAPEFLPGPRISSAQPPSSSDDKSIRRIPWILASGFALILIGMFTWSGMRSQAVTNTEKAQNQAENLRRSVLFDTSPSRLQALNLAEQGRVLIFPATDPERLRAAMHVFEAAMKLDPSYAGGYAGAAQVLGLMSLTTPDLQKSADLSSQSTSLALKSIELAPELAWPVSARAWAYFAKGDYDAAMEWSDRAKYLAPDDPNILEFDALILLYNGKFQEVLEETAQLAEKRSDALPFVFQNARSAAYFHLGEYEKSITGFEAAIAQGAPLGPVTVGYMMAAYQNLGDDKQAHELVSKYVATWPEQRIDLMKQRLFKNQTYSRQLVDGMLAAGWKPN